MKIPKFTKDFKPGDYFTIEYLPGEALICKANKIYPGQISYFVVGDDHQPLPKHEVSLTYDHLSKYPISIFEGFGDEKWEHVFKKYDFKFLTKEMTNLRDFYLGEFFFYRSPINTEHNGKLYFKHGNSVFFYHIENGKFNDLYAASGSISWLLDSVGSILTKLDESLLARLISENIYTFPDVVKNKFKSCFEVSKITSGEGLPLPKESGIQITLTEDQMREFKLTSKIILNDSQIQTLNATLGLEDVPVEVEKDINKPNQEVNGYSVYDLLFGVAAGALLLSCDYASRKLLHESPAKNIDKT